MTPAWVSDMICKDAPTPYGVRTLASIVLISSHPSLSHPEATVRTCVVGQSRNLWNIGGHGLGILGLKKAFLRLVLWCWGRAKRNLRPTGTRLAAFARGLDGVGRDGKLCPTETFLRRLVSGGSGAASPGRNRPDMTFQGAPFEAGRVGTQNGRAVSPWPDGTFRLRNKCARAAGARIGGSWRFEFFTWGVGDGCSPSFLAFFAGGVVVACPFYKNGRWGLVSFLSLLRHKALASCSFFCRHLLHFRRADTPLPPKAMAGVEAWPPCNVTKSALEARVKAGILRPLKDVGFPEWIVPSANDREPNPPPGYVVCFLSFLDRGFGIPAGRLIRAILHYYEVELHNLNPNSVMQAAVFATVCEGFLGVPVNWNLWLHLFKAEMSARYVGKEKIPLRGGGCTLQLRH